MSARFLLDTTMLSELVRRPQGSVGGMVVRQGEMRVLTSVVAAAELRYGLSKKFSARLSTGVERVLSLMKVAPLEPPADHVYGAVRADLERRGCIIGMNDLWIAAHALALDCTLVTDNTREFARVEGLRVENWLR